MNPKISTPSRWEKEAAKLAAYQRALQSGEPRAVMAFLVAARRHRAKQAWNNMLTRCYCKHADHFDRYGGRGISMCPAWKTSFAAFFSWANRNGFYTDLEIDRRNNDGNYTPTNCRWLTHLENMQNKRVTRKHSESSRRLLAQVNRAEVLRKAAAVNGKPVISSTGLRFSSAQKASIALGKNRNIVGQAIRKNYKLDGVTWSYA